MTLLDACEEEERKTRAAERIKMHAKTSEHSAFLNLFHYMMFEDLLTQLAADELYGSHNQSNCESVKDKVKAYLKDHGYDEEHPSGGPDKLDVADLLNFVRQYK